MSRSQLRNLCLTACLAASFVPMAAAQSSPYESYYLYLSDHPVYSDEAGYRENTQGVTHDDDYWFITQTLALWKIPVGHDLNAVSPSDPGVSYLPLSNVPELWDLDYDHFGDPTYRRNIGYDNEGYLVIPIEHTSQGGPPSIIAVFESSNLAYLGHAEVTWPDGSTALGWCAIAPDGYVYTSSWLVDSCYKYWLRWDLLPAQVVLEPVGEVPFYDEAGDPLTLRHPQGGVFSASGELLYINAGVFVDSCPGGDDVDEAWMRANGGIHVFNTQTWWRIAKSTNGYGYFDYEFYPGYVGGCEEPQGLTIWDLDDGRAPNITGQLHVFMLDNDWPSGDDVSMKHYTQTIYVDNAHSGPETGRPWEPFNTVGEAVNTYPAWPGSRISIKAGSYGETLTFSTRMQVIADGGTVTIGQ